MWTASVLAAADGIAPELAPYLNYGVLGLVVLALIFGWLFPKPAVDTLRAERDRLIEEKRRAEEQRDAAVAVAQDKLIPLLTTFVSTTEALIPLLQEIVREERDEHRRR